MSLNGSGVAQINTTGQPVVAGTTITASVFNALTADVASMISTCIMKDGQQTVTADIPFNNKKITGLAAGTARTDGASLATIQDGTGVYVGTVGGTADVITLTPMPAISAYVAGQTFRFLASGANTTNVTVNVSGLGAKAITKNGASELTAGDLVASSLITITYDGTRFILGTMPWSIVQLAQPNPIINGNMEIWQRGTTFVAAVNGLYSADRWQLSKSGAGAVTLNRTGHTPTVAQAGALFNFSLEVDVTTSVASPAAGDFYLVGHKIEGHNWRHFAQRQLTISFWVLSSKTGIHSVALRNSGLDRYYLAEYTVNAADTWELKTFTIPASPSAGTWNYTTGVGMDLLWTLAAGTTLYGTVGAWTTGNATTSPNQVNVMDSTANFFRITGVKMELGSVATPIQFVPFEKELARAKRYYQKSFDYATTPAQNTGVLAGTAVVLSPFTATNLLAMSVRFMSSMRGTPSLIAYNPQAANALVRNVSDATDSGTANFSNTSDGSTIISFSPNATNTIGDQHAVHWTADAEL